ncbi:MAG TPA: ring-cleaving dioxygenase [Gemmatimonadales bacterium]|nr:ring-cleaving dioxygenase [Gemmatimonadales bacterium]
MRHSILGLHHVTATVDEAQPDLDFCRRRLGLRLVKRTVNFDNHSVYHFYYGNETGEPGTIWTTFPYHAWGVPEGVHGAGQVVATAFSIPGGTLQQWRSRLRDAGLDARTGLPRFDECPLVVRDPSGLVIELVEGAADPRAPWSEGGFSPDMAIRGLHGVTLLLRERGPTIALMTGVLGFDIVEETPERTRLAVGGTAAGHLVDLVEAPDAAQARNGLGTVHHVAFAIASTDEQLELRRELIRLGASPTEVRDRTYFQSIYFREPGGVLFEVATVSPGFTVDEPLAQLGETLRLPPWEEPHRAEIERTLPPIAD